MKEAKRWESYPDSVITFDKLGNPQVRWFLDRGKFVKYQYRDPKTGRLLEKGKWSVILRGQEGEEEHMYIIPLPGKRGLVVWPKEEKKGRMVWNAAKKRAEKLF